jgi:hypothetical protein
LHPAAAAASRPTYPSRSSAVTTRTTTLTPISHASFALRFSDLVEIEAGCREPEEQRAERTIDWIGTRIAQKAAHWLADWDASDAAARERDGDPTVRTPWWEDLRRCVEGACVPARSEGWNHPVASACPLPVRPPLSRAHASDSVVQARPSPRQ